MTKTFKPIFTITNRITSGLTRIERARGFLEAATLSEDWVREMGRRALILEAHHTTHIEGTRLTLDQAERLLAIQGVREAGMEMTGKLEFFVDGLSTQLTEVRQRGEQAIRKDVIIKEHNLSDRQALAISHLLVHGRVSIQDFERLNSRVSRRTLQRDLKAMVDKGLIIEKASSPTDPTKIYILAGKLSG